MRLWASGLERSSCGDTLPQVSVGTEISAQMSVSPGASRLRIRLYDF